MSISLDSFLSTARLKDEGEVRVASGKTDQLVNKGTFGHRVATFFGMGDAASRPQRQTQAVASFQAALTAQYGAAAARQAIEAAGISRGGVLAGRLTGAQILKANDIASGAHARGAQIAQFSPGSAALQTIASQLRPPVVVADWPPATRLELGQRLAENFAHPHRPGPLLPADAQDIAKQTLKQVAGLHGAGRIAESVAARTDTVAAAKRVVADIALGRDGPTVAGRLWEMTAAVERSGRLDGLGAAPGRDESAQATERALLAAMDELDAENPGMVATAQARALEVGSSLRAVVGALDVGLETPLSGNPAELRMRDFNDRVSSGAEFVADRAAKMKSRGEDVAMTLARRLGPSAGPTLDNDAAELGHKKQTTEEINRGRLSLEQTLQELERRAEMLEQPA